MDNSSILNRFFSRSTFQSYLAAEPDGVFFSVIRRYVKEPDRKNNSSLISEVYHHLSTSYRNEYFYKNTLLNTLLLGIHKPTTTAALTEVPIGKSKADFILINGKAVVYEIKTELDNLDRLSSQIEDYYKAFRYVAVVTYSENYDAIVKALENSAVGIYVLSKDGRIERKKRREPKEYTASLDYETIFKILRKAEYEGILQQVNALPNSNQFDHYRECKRAFKANFSLVQSQTQLEICLKARTSIRFERYQEVPHELRFLAYFADMKDEDYGNLYRFLNSKALDN